MEEGGRGSDPPEDEPQEGEPSSSEDPWSQIPPPGHPASQVPPSRRRFRAATDNELDAQHFLIADDRAALVVITEADVISSDGGDAHFIGGLVRRLAEVLRETARSVQQGGQVISNAQLRGLRFGHSVVVELEISPSEQIQMDLGAERHAPTLDAARLVGDLLTTEAGELVGAALRLRPEAVTAYKRFLSHLSGQDVTLVWATPGAQQVIEVSSADARHDFAILDREGEPVAEPVTVPGKLTMADSELRQFALRLPPNLERPPLLKGKQRVRGTYTEEVGQQLHRDNLWDSDVFATINVTFDREGSTASPRDPEYVLVAAEPLVPQREKLL